MKDFVDTQCQGNHGRAQNASITRENGRLSLRTLYPAGWLTWREPRQPLTQALEGGLDQPIEVTAQVTEEQPVITSEALATIQDVLGTYTTDFSSSGAARSTNLAVGAAKINGHLLMPGDVLSGYECLQPFTTANGYKTAAAYENGQVVDSIGGGRVPAGYHSV